MNNLNRAASDLKLIFVTLLGGLILAGASTYPSNVAAVEPVNCSREVTADVVAIDQPVMFNRLGAQNINYMIYALKRDVVISNNDMTRPTDVADGTPLTSLAYGAVNLAGNVILRPDKRPRPLVLRVAAGDCLTVTLTNLLDPVANPLNLPNPIGGQMDGILFIDNQVTDRHISFHPLGLQLVEDISDDGSFVGKNKSSLLKPGDSDTYKYYAEAEGAFMVYSRGQPFGGEASGGNVGVGLFGVVNVEPVGADFYRSQLNEEEMRLAAPTSTATGQPIINYAATYPGCGDSGGAVWCAEGKAGLPIVSMLTASNEIVHSDINAIITGPNNDGSFPPSTYPLEKIGLRNPTVPNRLEAFREFTVVFHDEQAATQAFPKWFGDPVLSHTLHGVRDSFMINYGSGGIGSEIIANRLGVGPMHDCINCVYEEFFLTAYTVGDVAMLVDVPANTGLELCDPALNNCTAVGPKATQAFFPDDPSNVHHSYVGDFVKFRNLHAGPKEQHIFHLHNHQWLFNANDDNSNYLDAQGIGPGSGYTYEINFGGSGNRNKSAGDAIFHCHFYPHFAQGMWEMWRNHDVTETGTLLAVSDDGVNGDGYHDEPFALQNGRPAAGSRALPDGEIQAGTPIPALVPLPGKAMAPMPGKVEVVAVDKNAGLPGGTSSQALVTRYYTDGTTSTKQEYNMDGSDKELLMKNPGYPFWIAGIEHTVGQRPTTPPLDMLTEQGAIDLKDSGDPLWANMNAAQAGGFDGGLPRHTLDGYAAGGASANVQNRLDFSKTITAAKPVYFPEEGTDLEQLVMAFNAQREHPSCKLDIFGGVLCDADPIFNGNADVKFVTNGNLPAPSAPYFEPCMDDEGDLFLAGGQGDFFSADGFMNIKGTPSFGAMNPRTYKGANVQIDAVFNKAGYHFPQQRIIALWEDVIPTINQQRAPEPLVMRTNTYDCVKYLHTNLVPEYYELDDYQIRTPTDIIGQHIHLPKWDLVANDGSGNGWNYEDGTLSPGAVRERIEAINHFNDTATTKVLSGAENADGDLAPQPHPFFGAGVDGGTGEDPDKDNDWMGARTTIQRWFTDPVVNAANVDRGLGIIFTHDHYGPSTHQQVGLYATILAEPANSTWALNETGEPMYTRADGGPTSWQAQIVKEDGDAFREFYFEFSDFQHAYEKGVYVGAGPDGKPLPHPKDPVTHSPVTAAMTDSYGNIVEILPPVAPPSLNGIAANDTFRYSINPSYRQQPQGEQFPDILRFPPDCPGGALRPCAEAISADDVGMLVVNYRNEPIGLRVYDPNKIAPDGNPGMQADGLGGDLGYALATRTDRALPAFNTALGDTPYGPLTGGVMPGDPFTPLIRTYPADTVKIKIQSGATEHEHNATIHGVKWLQGGSGFGAAPNSGWRNAQNDGISEQFTFSMPVGSDPQSIGDTSDYAYSVDASQDGWWTGMWGIMRAYNTEQGDLQTLPNNTEPEPGRVVNKDQFEGVCPIDAPVRKYSVVAITANQFLGNEIDAILDDEADGDSERHVGARVKKDGGTLVYNNRPTEIRVLNLDANGELINPDDESPPEVALSLGGQSGPLHDPTALLYVMLEDLEPVNPGSRQCTSKKGLPGVLRPSCEFQLNPDAPVEPVVLRAAAGDCMKVTLYNKLPATLPDLAGYNTLLQVVNRDRNDPQGLTTFNNNLIRPSAHIGLHAQMVEYDVTRHDGTNVGLNAVQTVGPVNPDGDLDDSITYVWYAGDLTARKATADDLPPPDPDCKGKKCNSNGIGGNDLALIATPVEFGGFNLNPADKIKQGQKGLIGAGVIEPEDSSWPTDLADLDRASDHQVAYSSNGTATRASRTTATISYDGKNFRDAAIIFQKALNHRFGDGSPVPNIASEGLGIPEDSHDAGQMAINYGSEPLWFRYGMPADSPFEKSGLGGVQNSYAAFSNVCCNNGGTATTADANVGDPVTQVITAAAGQGLRMRLLEPTGAGRGTTFNLHGHAWQRAPYIFKDAGGGEYYDTDSTKPVYEPELGDVASQRIGDNWLGMVLGHQESVTPSAHFDIVPLHGAGGKAQVPGDYLFSDQASFGATSGLWGILRVE